MENLLESVTDVGMLSMLDGFQGITKSKLERKTREKQHLPLLGEPMNIYECCLDY